MVNDLDESIRPRELMHVQLYAPLYQRIASATGANVQGCHVAPGCGDKDAKVITRATSMPKMGAEPRSSSRNNVDIDNNKDNNEPNTLTVLFRRARKRLFCNSGGLSGKRGHATVQQYSGIHS
ncbi:hypothetical protein ACHAW5_002726 [Stephanodiscus triporus]|uniref:Uncharacterized protein n=1 Tax=Stephanodiscus triporus TaxID=2934178 RepID=A0ABD3MHF5_9STRA